MPWIQRTILLAPYPRGFHLITRQVVEALPELEQIDVGLLHVFIQHTSASVAINENADPDVPADLETSLSAIAPEDFPYRILPTACRLLNTSKSSSHASISVL